MSAFAQYVVLQAVVLLGTAVVKLVRGVFISPMNWSSCINVWK